MLVCPTICFSFYFSLFPVLTAAQSYAKHTQHIHSTDRISYLPIEDKCPCQMKNIAISFYLSIYSSLREILMVETRHYLDNCGSVFCFIFLKMIRITNK